MLIIVTTTINLAHHLLQIDINGLFYCQSIHIAKWSVEDNASIEVQCSIHMAVEMQPLVMYNNVQPDKVSIGAQVAAHIRLIRTTINCNLFGEVTISVTYSHKENLDPCPSRQCCTLSHPVQPRVLALPLPLTHFLNLQLVWWCAVLVFILRPLVSAEERYS